MIYAYYVIHIIVFLITWWQQDHPSAASVEGLIKQFNAEGIEVNLDATTTQSIVTLTKVLQDGSTLHAQFKNAIASQAFAAANDYIQLNKSTWFPAKPY